MTEQLNRYPLRHVEPHPLDGTLAMAGKLITAPIRGLHYIERSLKGTYTPSQNFFSRYEWALYHVEDLHKSLSSPNFWVKWSRQGNATYIEIQDQLSTLHREREKARAIYAQQRYYRGRPTLRDLSTRAIACTDLSSIDQRLHDIHLRTTKASGQSYIDKKQKDATEIQKSIESLKSAPIESSWETWLLKHQTTCHSIQSSISALNHTTYLHVSEGREKLQGINTQDLNTLLYNALVDVALKHYKTHVSHEYRTLYEEVKAQLESLKNQKTAYHSSWTNYLWSYWESNHRTQASLLYQKIFRLNSLHQEYVKTVQPDQNSNLPSPADLQRSFKGIFCSFKPLNAVDLALYSLISAIPEEWKAMRHRGIPIHCGEPKLASALQLMFSDPTLAKHILRGPRQLELLGQLYDSYLQAQWNAQWAALETFIQTMDPAKPITFDQFIHRLDSLYSSTPANRWHLACPFYDLIREAANRTSYELITAFLSRLDQEKSPLFYTLVHQTIGSTGVTGERQTQQPMLHLDCSEAETLEALLERQFNAPQEKTYFTSPPEYLIINLQRTRENQGTPIGLQEEFFLLPTHTTSRKGAAYELISFTSSDTHYRKTPFGYTRISNTLEEITQLDFLIAAQTASTCVLRRSDTNIPELELFQRAQQNRLRFTTLQFKMSAIHAIYGQSTFEIPAPHQKAFQHLVDFIQCVAKTSSLPERMFGKNPNDDLERTFQKLPKKLQTFLLNTLQVPI